MHDERIGQRPPLEFEDTKNCRLVESVGSQAEDGFCATTSGSEGAGTPGLLGEQEGWGGQGNGGGGGEERPPGRAASGAW